MYTSSKKPDSKVLSVAGLNLRPIITLESKFAESLQICKEDDNFVLYESLRTGVFKKTTQWPKEAIKACAAYVKKEKNDE